MRDVDNCKQCGGIRIMRISAKCSDRFYACMGQTPDEVEYQGYVLSGAGIGGGDYVEFDYCLDCGQIQGDQFPIADSFSTLVVRQSE